LSYFCMTTLYLFKIIKDITVLSTVVFMFQPVVYICPNIVQRTVLVRILIKFSVNSAW
jgi:hypothetical protein